MKAALLSFWILASLSQTLRALSAATEIVISVPDQQLAVIDRGKLISKYATRHRSSVSEMAMELIGHRSAHCLFRRSSVIVCQLAR